MTTRAIAGTRTVLVADDTAFVRDRFKAALESGGHHVLTACSAAELLLRIRTNLDHLDLVVLDLRLPDANGLDLPSAIRTIDGGKLPILVFSGTVASAAEVHDLTALGIAGYVNEYATVQHILPALLPYLFPERSNRRRSPRVILGIPIAYRFGNTIAAALTLNLSHGGIAIRTTSPLDEETCVRLRFRLPGAPREIDATARVAWSDRRVGMGLLFEQVASDDQRDIDDFVDQHFFSNRRA